jgi:predicted small lipoprotein YifL
MWRVAIRGSLLIVALLAASIALAACGSSDQPAEQQTAASGSAQSPAQFAAGQSVAARWTDGKLYLATVTAVAGENVTVTYTDDGSSATVPATDVRAIPDTTFAVGDRVLAVWSGGRFYPSEVSKVEGTTYTVKWDDASQPSTVEAGKIIAE